jgi:hypothetical protein
MRHAVLIRSLVALVAAVPGVALGLFAWPHLLNGLALDAAIPVPIYMIRQTPMLQSAYRRAAHALVGADLRDGDAQTAAAEAATRAGGPAQAQIARLEQAVRDAPAEPRGWLLLSEALLPVDRKRAASALEQALVLAPYDYWIAGRRARDAVVLWGNLDFEAREMALRQVQFLWDEPSLRSGLVELLSTASGVAIVRRAFSQRPGDLRDLNRWMSKARRVAAERRQQ